MAVSLPVETSLALVMAHTVISPGGNFYPTLVGIGHDPTLVGNETDVGWRR